MEEVLFLGLSRRSTGEVTYTVQQLLGREFPGRKPRLCLHQDLAGVAGGFSGPVEYHQISQQTPAQRGSYLSDQLERGGPVVFIDWNAFLLECNVTVEEKKALENLVVEAVNSGTPVAMVDYFSTALRDPQVRQNKLARAVEGHKKKTQSLPLTHRLVYYVKKFVPIRMELQVSIWPEKVKIFRPVPLNAPQKVDGIDHYSNLFPQTLQRGEPQGILLALSRFFEFSVDRTVLESLWNNLVLDLSRHFPGKKITVIDPFGLSWPLGQVEGLSVVPWMPRESLEEQLSEALFVGLMVPYGTLGTMALQRGVPFVTFHASGSTATSSSFASLLRGTPFPGFNALGVWEDEVFLPELLDQGEYFRKVIFADLCDPQIWSTLKVQLEAFTPEPLTLGAELPGLWSKVEDWLGVKS